MKKFRNYEQIRYNEVMELVEGNKAIFLGALRAGATFYAGYPITPSSEIMEYWAKEAAEPENKGKLKFLQTEDEIAAIHTTIGGALAGEKAFTATSGPGFSLMQEGIGLAFVYEAPIVIVDSQRQGPSTGMPTLPAQGDILQTQFGSHGDYKTVVYYPNSVSECYELTIEAFNTAQKYQTPVILLLDAFISHLSESVDLKYKGSILQSKIVPLGKSNSPRYYTGLTSDEGVPATKDYEAYKKWIAQRISKFDNFETDTDIFEFYGSPKAQKLIIATGIISRLVYDIVDQQPEKYALLRPRLLFPIHKKLIAMISRFDNVVSLEMNTGQYSMALRSASLKDIKHIQVGAGGHPDMKEIETALQFTK